MATQQDVTQQPDTSGSRQPAQRSESAMRPPVDIFETSDGITLNADMPGVSKEHLNLQVEGNTLTVEGELQVKMPEDMEPIYADVRSRLYRLSFVLSSELESGRVEASLKDGVLTVRIPKRAELRPRRIEVRSS
jgi:HSP20 family molecular chaperone IbpA